MLARCRFVEGPALPDRGRNRAPWTGEDDAELRRRCEAGEFLLDIAVALGRSQEACRTRANKLHVHCQSSPRSRRVADAPGE